jgi:hypothetical protein
MSVPLIVPGAQKRWDEVVGDGIVWSVVFSANRSSALSCGRSCCVREEIAMSYLRVLICRVDDEEDDQMTELASLDLPDAPAHGGAAGLDSIEATVARAGQHLLARLCELQWEEADAQAVARYGAQAAPGTVVADGYETLQAASRFGTLQLRRQVLAHRDGRPHVMPGNALLPPHQGMVITRGLQEQVCLLCQDLPFATAARLLGWRTGEPGLLSASTLRSLVREHGQRIRALEQTEAVALLRQHAGGRRLRGVPLDRPRRRPGWPPDWSAAVAAALERGARRPPEGVAWGDWERVRAARAEDPATPLQELRRLGPEFAPGQTLLVLDEVLTPAPSHDQFHELRTAYLATAQGRRYLSGRGYAFVRQVHAAVHACVERSLLVVADGAAWIRTFYRDYLAPFPGAEMLLDWHHLAQKCRDLARAIQPEPGPRARLLRRLFCGLWRGDVPRALRVLHRQRPQAADPQALEALCAYLQARAEWIPDYGARRRQRRYIGNGLGEKANDRIVARRQKRRGMQWSVQTSDALAALRTLLLNEGWETYWQEWHVPCLAARAA